MKYMIAAGIALCFSLSVDANEPDAPSGAPTDNCDKEITSLTAPCKPPVSIRLLTENEAARIAVPNGCVLNGRTLVCNTN